MTTTMTYGYGRGFVVTTLGAAWTVDNAMQANVVEVVSSMAHTGTNSGHTCRG